MKATSPVNRWIDSVMRCVKCGAKMGQCDCWQKCSCGRDHQKGKPCRNPETKRCSSKVAFGKYNRKTKAYE